MLLLDQWMFLPLVDMPVTKGGVAQKSLNQANSFISGRKEVWLRNPLPTGGHGESGEKHFVVGSQVKLHRH